MPSGLTAIIVITTIPTQKAGTAFTVTGSYTLSSTAWTEELVYEDNLGAQTSIPTNGLQLGTSSFSFTNPGLAVGTHTVTVKDPLTGSAVTSNSFLVTATDVLTASTPSGVVVGTPFNFTGSLSGYTAPPVLTYSLSGGAPFLMSGVTLTAWSQSITIFTAGTYTLSASDSTNVSNTVSFTVAPATVNHVIAITAISPSPTAGAAFTLSGTLTGYTTPPSLTYSINAGSKVTMTGVTATGWSMQINAPTTAGSYNILVTDGTTSASTTFTVLSAAHIITPLSPTGATVGTPFTFTGTLSGYTTVPALTYKVNGGASTALSGVSISGWAQSITIPTSGSTTIAVTDGTVTGTVTFNVAAANVTLRNWYQNPGMDGSFWVQPFQSSSNWITSGALVTALRNGSNSTPTGAVNLPGNFSAPFYIGQSTDPTVTVTNGTHSIVVHIPLGAVVETPNSGSDNSIGGCDATQPYLVWSISGASINGTGAVAASGSVITGTYGMTVMDGSGLMMVDAVTGNAGNANSFGGVTSYDLQQLAASSSYVMQHMLAYSLDPNSQCSGAGPLWPLQIVDTSSANTGTIPQGATIGIPASTGRPTGQTRGFYAWFDMLQQFGAFFYNVAASGATTFFIYDELNAEPALVADMQASLSAVMAYVCILNYASGTSGAQYSLATTKGAIAGSTNAFPAPAPLNLAPTGGVNVAPSTFGAWYPSGYNAIPTNSATAATYAITPNTPSGVVVSTAFTFSGSLSGYTAAPGLTYSINGGAAVALGGVTTTGWSVSLIIPTAGTTVISVVDSTHGVSGTTSFNVTSSAPTVTPVTWNPAAIGGAITLSNGNYTATAGGSGTPYAAPAGVLGTAPINLSQAVMFEVTFPAITQDCAVGVANTTFSLVGSLGADTNGIGFYPSTGTSSQPAQTVYYNNNQLTSGNGVSSVAGAVVTAVINGDNLYVSDAAMRSTSGVNFNGSTTANPVTNTGGFSFVGIGATFYPVFQTSEGGGVAVLNDGTSAFSSFGSAFLAANPGVVTLSGQVTSGGGTTHTITPISPSGAVAGAPFTFTGTLGGYTAAPNLTYSLNGASYVALPGVTATGWSATITSQTTGTNTLVVTDGAISATTTFSVAATGGGGTGTRISAPLTGTITVGTWILGVQLSSFKNGPAGAPMQYSVLLPANYSASFIYPVLFFGHENDEGMNGGSYPLNANTFINQNQNFGTLSFNQIFNTVAFRTAFPCILVCPQCDQSLDTSGANGNANFGGYADTPNSGWNEQAINAIAGVILSTYSADATRFYCGGCSLGGIGALAWCVDNNAYNGVNKIWAAGFSLSDQLYRPGVNGGSNTAAFASMQGVPFFAVPTSSDNSPTSYDLPAWTYYTSNTSYPGPSNYSAGGAAACRAGSTSYYLLDNGGNFPAPQYMQTNADGGSATALYTWLFSIIASSGVMNPTITGLAFAPATSIIADSPSGTVAGTLTAASSNGALSGITYALNSTTNFKVVGTQVEFNSATVATGTYPLTVTVTATNATNSPQTYPITISVATNTAPAGSFSVSGGKLLGPNGQPFIARGVNFSDNDSGQMGMSAATLLRIMPGVNFIRLACYNMSNPASFYTNFIQAMTANQIVVELEDHTTSTGSDGGGASGVVFTGSLLSTEQTWYANLAAANKGNPYVWFGTNNEPAYSPSIAALCTWQQTTYNTIRNAGASNIIMVMLPGGGNPGTYGSSNMTASVYAPMTNILWDMHGYAWQFNSGGNNGQTGPGAISATALAVLYAANITTAQTITSANGTIPVICGEYGISTDGSSLDVSGTQNCQAIQSLCTNTGSNVFVGCAAWHWSTEDSYNNLTNGDTGSLTSYGTQVETFVGAAAPSTSLTAAALVTYLNGISGTKTISGQFIERGSDPTYGYAAIQAIQANTGYWLGMIGGDYWFYGSTATTADLTFNTYAEEYWNASGLVTLIFSMPNPTTGGASYDVSNLSASQILTSGTATNTNFVNTLNQIAAGLLALKNAGVVVIVRPFHENNGNWFWWGTSFLTAAQFVSVWQYVHNYFTNTKGLNNLVWLWSVNAGISGFSQTAARYPGSSYVDVVGYDLYTSSPADASDYTAIQGIAPGKPTSLPEFGPGSPSAGDTSFNEGTLISAINSSQPDTVLFQQWWGANSGGVGWGMAETSSWANVTTALGNSRVLNRGQITFF